MLQADPYGAQLDSFLATDPFKEFSALNTLPMKLIQAIVDNDSLGRDSALAEVRSDRRNTNQRVYSLALKDYRKTFIQLDHTVNYHQLVRLKYMIGHLY